MRFMRPAWLRLPPNIQAAYYSRATPNRTFPTDEPPPNDLGHGQWQLPLFIEHALAGDPPTFRDSGELDAHFSINIELPPDPRNLPKTPNDVARMDVTDLPFRHNKHTWYPKAFLGEGACGRATLWVKTGGEEGDKILDVVVYDRTMPLSIHCWSLQHLQIGIDID